MNKFEELEAFVEVVDRHSFSDAAEKLGVSKSILSRRVSDLEKRLGVQLMRRTTRRQSLTDAGRHFYERAIHLLSDLKDAEQMVSDAQAMLSGKIKLAAPLGIGIGQLSEPIAEFMQIHTDVEVSVELDDRNVDLVGEGFDLAVRVGQLQDSNLIARKLAEVNFATCASSDYLAIHGEPKHPSELSEHQVMHYSNVQVGDQWFYFQSGKRITPRMNYRLSANNGEFLARTASCGLGICALPLFYLQEYIDRGELIPILKDYPRDAAGMYAVYPPGRLVSRRVKMLSDYLFAYFRNRVI
ncbi:MAG: LysR family transcriptional regulator [Gammaproteobacteria bacterium]|nr:LysR family transcriptional regulator [Gammaproteobacteria bacterium]